MGLRERIRELERRILKREKPKVFDVILEDDVPPEGEKDEGTEKENPPSPKTEGVLRAFWCTPHPLSNLSTGENLSTASCRCFPPMCT